MPLVVNVLEALDLSYLEKEEMSVDLEMLKVRKWGPGFTEKGWSFR